MIMHDVIIKGNNKWIRFNDANKECTLGYTTDMQLLFLSSEYSMSTQPDSEYQFRYKLKCLSDQLTTGDIDDLKFLCSDHINVEEVTSGIILWKRLQDCGKLSSGNLDYLKLLLTEIKKQHLYENIFTRTSNGVPHSSQPSQTNNEGAQAQARSTVQSHNGTGRDMECYM